MGPDVELKILRARLHEATGACGIDVCPQAGDVLEVGRRRVVTQTRIVHHPPAQLRPANHDQADAYRRIDRLPRAQSLRETLESGARREIAEVERPVVPGNRQEDDRTT